MKIIINVTKKEIKSLNLVIDSVSFADEESPYAKDVEVSRKLVTKILKAKSKMRKK